MEKLKRDNFHSKPSEKVLQELSSGIDGISESEAEARLNKFGPNEMPEKKGKHPVFFFLKQFKSALIYILILAAVISFSIGNMVDVVVISAVILINAIIGFVQEYKAERSIQALKKTVVRNAKVYREGELLEIPTKKVVQGDILFLEEGDRVPADARIIEQKNLRTVEASLTGESLPVEKTTNVLPEKTGISDCKNMIWMGTYITGGHAKAVVTGTGANTAIGKIARSLEKVETKRTHFETKMDVLAKKMGLIAVTAASITFMIGFLIRGFGFLEIFLFTLASLVSGIPEGLPAVLVIVLAIGAGRMAKRNAIIRTLPTTETLGVVTAIATDKTGTITQNTMNVEKIVMPDEDEISISGEGWEPSGDFSQNGDIIFPLENSRISKLLHISAVCNNAKLVKEENEAEKYKIIGDPTEAALLVLAEKAGLKQEVLNEREKKIDDLPFNPELKYRASLSVLVEADKKKEIYVVGAPEAVLEKASYTLGKDGERKLTSKEKEEILSRTGGLAKQAMRTLALAYKKAPSEMDVLDDDYVDDLVLVGVVGMMDPPKPEVSDAIAKARNAGIRVIMKTGDHKDTAVAIAKKVGLIKEGEEAEALTEQELLELSDEEFEEAVKNVPVFARITPEMKLKLVETLQEQGHIVAMTGDGVNDAPALKKADVGISMGIIGTDVAREASGIVLEDDNFATIVNAIEEGRTVFTNTRHSSSFLVTTNFAEHVSIIAALILGFPLPMLPIQILWLNLITDTPCASSLAFEPPQKRILERPPRKKTESILSKEILPFILIMVIVMATAALFSFKTFLSYSVEKARTGAFIVMAFTQLFNAMNMRSLKESIFKVGLLRNKILALALGVSIILLLAVLYIPFLQTAFQFIPLSAYELLGLGLLSSLVLWFGELYKYLKRNSYSK